MHGGSWKRFFWPRQRGRRTNPRRYHPPPPPIPPDAADHRNLPRRGHPRHPLPELGARRVATRLRRDARRRHRHGRPHPRGLPPPRDVQLGRAPRSYGHLPGLHGPRGPLPDRGRALWHGFFLWHLRLGALLDLGPAPGRGRPQPRVSG